MKTTCVSRFLAFCLVSAAASISAQEPVAPPKPVGDAAKPSVDFLGKTYTYGKMRKGKTSMTNMYFLAGQGANNWTSRVMQHFYLNRGTAEERAKRLVAFLKEKGHDAELATDQPEGTAGVYIFEVQPKVVIFTALTFQETKNKKGLIAKEYNLNGPPDMKEKLRALSEKHKKGMLAKLVATQFPRLIFPKKKIDPKASAVPTELPVLKLVPEKVTDIQGKGKKVTIDEAFAKKNGAEPGGHVPFTLELPRAKAGQKVLAIARPKVPELVRYTLVEGEKTMKQSIRFARLKMGAEEPMEKRLQRSAALLESGMVPKFFAGHQSGKIGQRYRTKVGPYDAACLLGMLTSKDGAPMYIKFVAILPEGKPEGLVAVMVLNPKGDKPEEVKKELSDGFVQQILHSVRLKE